MKTFHVLVALQCLCSSLGMAQTPGSRPFINVATQTFLKENQEYGTYKVFSDQNLSPRILKPTGNPEKIRVMYIGHWLDITDEVRVSGGGGVSFSGIIARGHNDQWRPSININNGTFAPVFSNYNGVYCIVEFTISSSAAVGTHTVKLLRPRLGQGKDEAEFYLEVRDFVRIYEIDFKGSDDANFQNNGRQNERGRVRIQGQNLDQITNVGNGGGFFSDVSNVAISDKTIAFDATLARTGTVDVSRLMSSVSPRGLITSEYPISVPPGLDLDILAPRQAPITPAALPDLLPLNSTTQFIFGGANGTFSDGTLTYEALPESFCLSLPTNYATVGTLANGFSPATTDRRILRLNFPLPDIGFTIKNQGNAPSGADFQVKIFQGTSTTQLLQRDINALAPNATFTVTLGGRGTVEVFRLPGLDGNDPKACYIRRDNNNNLPQTYLRENQGFTFKVDTNGAAPSFAITESNENNNTQLIRAGTTAVVGRQ